MLIEDHTFLYRTLERLQKHYRIMKMEKKLKKRTLVKEKLYS